MYASRTDCESCDRGRSGRFTKRSRSWARATTANKTTRRTRKSRRTSRLRPAVPLTKNAKRFRDRVVCSGFDRRTKPAAYPDRACFCTISRIQSLASRHFRRSGRALAVLRLTINPATSFTRSLRSQRTKTPTPSVNGNRKRSSAPTKNGRSATKRRTGPMSLHRFANTSIRQRIGRRRANGSKHLL